MNWWKRIRGSHRDEAMLPLYRAVVARGRAPHWYLDGAVPDTLDGRFDMIAAVLAMVLLRLEERAEEQAVAAGPAAALTEHFVDDMDAQLRQIGFGDMVFYLEAIANDASLLAPLLANNGEGFRKWGDEA